MAKYYERKYMLKELYFSRIAKGMGFSGFDNMSLNNGRPFIETTPIDKDWKVLPFYKHNDEYICLQNGESYHLITSPGQIGLDCNKFFSFEEKFRTQLNSKQNLLNVFITENELDYLSDLINQGKTNYEIIENFTNAVKNHMADEKGMKR